MPLTTRGICVQIMASVQALRDHSQRCSTNDCKVVLNHLVRKFSEPLSRAGQQQRRMSRRVAQGDTDDTVEDHAVPVIVVVEELLNMPAQDLQVTDSNIRRLEQFLTESLLLVEITREEDLQLCSKGLQRCMPEGWTLATGREDSLARYRHAGVEI